MTDLTSLTIAEAREGLASKSFTAAELTDAHLAAIEAARWQAGRLPVYSNASAALHAAEPALVKQAMAEHLVKPVEFVAQIEAMHAAGARVFIEVGPKAVLSRLVGRILDGKPHQAVALDERGGGLASLLLALALVILLLKQWSESRIARLKTGAQP